MIRQATKNDIGDIVALIKEVAPEIFPQNKIKEWLEKNASSTVIKARLEDKHYMTFVAYKEACLAGTGYVEIRDEEAYLGGLYCRIKRQGVGEALVRQRIEVVENKVKRIMMTVSEDNLAMLKLASKLGFIVVDRSYDKTGIFSETVFFDLRKVVR